MKFYFNLGGVGNLGKWNYNCVGYADLMKRTIISQNIIVMLMGVRFSNSNERTSGYSLILFRPLQFFSRGYNYRHNIPLDFPMFNCSVIVHIPLVETHGFFGNLVITLKIT